MDSTFGLRLSQVWFAIQDGLFAQIESQLGATLTKAQAALHAA